MTVSSQTNKISYIGNGVATEFAIPFYFLKESHLQVYQLLNDIQTMPANYSIQGAINANGGTIIFDTAPENGAEILIIRDVPMTQETDYQDNQVFHADTLEQGLDKLTMQVQQLSERIDRAVTVDFFSEENGSDLLPSIKQSVSDSASYAQTATEQAEIAADKVVLATEQVVLATEQVDLATEQATLATTKANEAITTLEEKANKIDVRKLIETYHDEETNGWYKIFEETQSDGSVKYWCEQGGKISALVQDSTITVSLLVNYIDNNYFINRDWTSNFTGASTGVRAWSNSYSSKTATNFSLIVTSVATSTWWKAEGYCNTPV